ncbi:MAG: ClpX C4-type zinc finger protein [Candidatus Thiodiazotropha sp.]
MPKDLSKLEKMISEMNRHVDKIRRGDGVWCSFCGKEEADVKEMLRSPDPKVNICNECVEKAYSMLNSES